MQAVQAIVDAGDGGAVPKIMRLLGIEIESINAQIEQFAKRLVIGWGGYSFCGTPEQVTDQSIELKKAGALSMSLMWRRYAQEIAYFGQKGMPLPRGVGLRI
jgi:FMNH2-dependent dimethyl sulfone monooxygenase